MARYAHASLAEYASSNALLDHAREVAMRRDRGRVFLERALAAGEQAALLEYSRAYGDGGVFEPDAVRAQAYWRAYRSTPAGRQVPAAADRMRLRGLSDTEARESERLARRIEARFQQARRRR